MESNNWIETMYEEYLIGRVLLVDGFGAMGIAKDPRGENLYKCQLMCGSRGYAIMQWQVKSNTTFLVGTYLPGEEDPCRAYEVTIDPNQEKAESVKSIKSQKELSRYFEKLFRHQLDVAA